MEEAAVPAVPPAVVVVPPAAAAAAATGTISTTTIEAAHVPKTGHIPLKRCLLWRPQSPVC